MKSLYDYEVLVNDTFYRSWHILDYIEKHKNMSELDKEAIKATIMDALVYTKAIDSENEFLNLENGCITNNPNDYKYEVHPNISGFPMWLKEKMRYKTVRISAGIPVSMYVARPSSYRGAYCVYDPTLAVGAVFDDFKIIEAKYISPTRGIMTEDVRPFAEVDLNGELYLIDVLTKRVFKSSWFAETFKMEVVAKNPKHAYIERGADFFDEKLDLATYLGFTEFISSLTAIQPKDAEYNYEKEKTKEIYPKQWELYDIYEREKEAYFSLRNNKKSLF